jgi:hypothetical protein
VHASHADSPPSAQEGGPKGVAIAQGLFVVTSPEIGVRVHRAR